MYKRIGIGILLILIAGVVGMITQGQTEAVMLRTTGNIDSATPFIEIPIEVTEADSTVIVDLEATSGNLDPLLYLVDSNGAIVAENDDRIQGDLNSRIVFPRALPGSYTVIATRLRVEDGDTTGAYDLRVDIDRTSNTSDLAYAVSEADLRAKGFPDIEQRPEAEWTILAYYGGDTNLEAGVMNDFNEFELAGGSDETVRIVGLLDRHPGYTDADGDWSTTRLFEVQADVSNDTAINFPPTIDSEPLADLGDLNTGDGETLAQFLVWAIRHYPAKRYAIALSSHGGAWQGIITDESSDFSILTLPELDAALSVARQEIDGRQFDILVNDACSMSSVEYYAAVDEHFDITIGSPEIVITPALDMTLFTQWLKEDPERDLVQLSTDLIDTYMNREVANRNLQDSNYLNYAASDLNRFDPVVAAIEDFAALMNSDSMVNSTLIGAARSNTYSYSSFVGEAETIDAGDFMKQIIAISPDPEIVQGAQRVLQALDDSRLYGNAAEQVRDSVSFYNIYFPDNSKEFDQAYLQDSPLTQWSQMLRAYYNATTPQLWQVEESLLTYHPSIAPQVKVTQVYPEVSSVNVPPAIYVEIVGRRISQGAFTIDRVLPDGTLVRLSQTDILTQVVRDGEVSFINSWRSGVDQSVFNWLPVTLPTISDGVNTANELLIQTNDVAALEGRYRRSDEEPWSDVTLIFGLDGRVRNIISESTSGGLASIDIPTGATFQAYQFIVTADGEEKPEPGNLYTWPEGGLVWADQPTVSGEYELGFLVTAFGGVSGFDSVRITVDNSQIDESTRGFTEANLGINFQIPATWSPVAELGNLLNSINAEGDTVLNIYHFSAEDNVFDITREVQDRYALNLTRSAEGIGKEGKLGLTFDYEYFTEDSTRWQGRAAVFYHDTTLGGRGIVFALETKRDDANTILNTQYAALFNTLTFFDASGLKATSTEAWTYQFFEGRIPYPVLRDWVVVDASPWTQYVPPNSRDPLTQISIRRLAGNDPEAALEAVTDEWIARGLLETRVYNAEHHTWQVASYATLRTGLDRDQRLYSTDVVGRIYVTEINNQIYAIAVETPDNEQAPEIFRTIYEPLIDGFAPPTTQDFTNGSTREAFIKVAVVSANDVCEGAERNELCFGGGQAVQVRYQATASAQRLAELGERVTLDDMLGFQVGIMPDGSVDPFSVAVVDLPANYPLSSPQTVKIIAFGGTTILNRSLPPEDFPLALEIENTSGSRINIRRFPNEESFIIGAVEPAGQLIALSRLENMSWVRVRVPSNEAIIGWVRADLIEPVDQTIEEDILRIETSSIPYYTNMQAIDIFLDEAVLEGDTFPGVLIQTAPGQNNAYLQINGAVFQIEGDSLFYWRGTNAGLQEITDSEQQSVFGESANRRLPGAWSSEVLTGSVSVQFANDIDNEFSLLNQTVSTAGASLFFDGDIQVAEADGSEAAALFESSFEGTQTEVED